MKTLRSIVLTASLLVGGVRGIYDDDHWSYSTKLTEENFDSFVMSNLEAAKTVFVVKAFSGNDDVVFGDVNLAETPGLRRDYSPGSGGWPTIRYFNSETGISGGVYEKKTDMSMCEELGPKYDYMEQYVEDYGNTSLCSLDGSGCDERSIAFIEKMKPKDKSELEAQISRLENLEASEMKDDLKDWVKRRKKILTQLSKVSATDSSADEL